MLFGDLQLVHRRFRHRRPEGRRETAGVEQSALRVLCNAGPNFDAKLRLGSFLSAGRSQLIRAR
jgi:hypothetical protein